MLIFEETELQKAVDLSLQEAVKEVGSITENNKEEILANGYRIICSYKFKKLGQFYFDRNTGEAVEKIVHFAELNGCKYTSGYPVYKRLADFSRLPIKNPFIHKTDKNKFIKTCLKLFPNVDAYNAGHCLTNFRKIIQNIYYNLGTEGLRPQQVCFYQYSALGGTGKSLFYERLETFLKKMNLPSTRVNLTNTRWIGSEYSSNIVGIENEFFPLRGSEADIKIKTINNIVDNTEYEVEYKGMNSFMNHSRVSLFINSNRLPFDNNTRRYGIVRYNEIPYSVISKEDREKYFPERSEEEWNQILLDAFESCPFDEVFEDTECKNDESLNDLIYAAKEVIGKVSDYEVFASDLTNCTIRNFVTRYLATVTPNNTVTPEAVKKLCFQWRNDIRRAVAQGLINPSTRVNGNLDYSKYNFQDIANLPTPEDEIDTVLNNINSPFERTKVAFENFLDKEQNSTPDPTKPKDKLSDGWIFNDYFVTGEGQTGFNRPEYTNMMQKQVCINKQKAGVTEISRKNEDVECCNFLFEIDPPKYEDSAESLYMSKEDYYKKELIRNGKEIVIPALKELKDCVIWCCLSGSKSTHVVIHTNNTNPEAYKHIWNKLNKKYFQEKCDKQCSNPGRLARNPNAIRENGKLQKALLINENATELDVSTIVNDFLVQKRLDQNIQAEKRLHMKQFTDINQKPILEQLKSIVDKTQNVSGKLAYDILSSGVATSGSNMIGAIGYMKKLTECLPDGEKFLDLLEDLKYICHSQHPSNIPGKC